MDTNVLMKSKKTNNAAVISRLVLISNLVDKNP